MAIDAFDLLYISFYFSMYIFNIYPYFLLNFNLYLCFRSSKKYGQYLYRGDLYDKKNVSFFYIDGDFLYLKQPSLKKSKYIDYSNAFTSSFSSRKKWQYASFGSYHILYLIDYHFWNLCSIKMFKVLQIISNLYKILSFSLVFTFLAENHL